MKLSDKLIELRKERGWSQEDFAEKLDVSRQAISRWETGTALPDAQNVLRISKIFNVTADYLLNDDYEYEDVHIPSAEAETEETVSAETDAVEADAAETESVAPKKRRLHWWYLIPAACLVLLVTCTLIILFNNSHPTLISVKENEIAPTCKSKGSYDEVIYCGECDEEILRTTKTVAKLPHTLADSVKENEVAPTCQSEGSYDEVVYCGECGEEILCATKTVAKLPHTLSDSVKEKETAPTCQSEGSYDEVVYCTECKGEVLRTHKTIAKLAHKFQNNKCTVCGRDQVSEGLSYMSNGDGTCFIDGGDCTDEDVYIPDYSPSGDRVVQIKAYAFAGRTKIKSIRIPETVTVIGDGAFMDCTDLESVNLPSGIKIIYPYTFRGCKNLKGVTIPSGVYTIATEAFADCVAFESIVIPASVYKIGPLAFKNFSGGNGNVTFEVYDGWVLYDSKGEVNVVDFKGSLGRPVMLLSFRYAEYTWKRDL